MYESGRSNSTLRRVTGIGAITELGYAKLFCSGLMGNDRFNISDDVRRTSFAKTFNGIIIVISSDIFFNSSSSTVYLQEDLSPHTYRVQF